VTKRDDQQTRLQAELGRGAEIQGLRAETMGDRRDITRHITRHWFFFRTCDAKREADPQWETVYPPLAACQFVSLPRKSHVLGPRAATRVDEHERASA
jgi:hypothetical protein